MLPCREDTISLGLFGTLSAAEEKRLDLLTSIRNSIKRNAIHCVLRKKYSLTKIKNKLITKNI